MHDITYIEMYFKKGRSKMNPRNLRNIIPFIETRIACKERVSAKGCLKLHVFLPRGAVSLSGVFNLFGSLFAYMQ